MKSFKNTPPFFDKQNLFLHLTTKTLDDGLGFSDFHWLPTAQNDGRHTNTLITPSKFPPIAGPRHHRCATPRSSRLNLTPLSTYLLPTTLTTGSFHNLSPPSNSTHKNGFIETIKHQMQRLHICTNLSCIRREKNERHHCTGKGNASKTQKGREWPHGFLRSVFFWTSPFSRVSGFLGFREDLCFDSY